MATLTSESYRTVVDRSANAIVLTDRDGVITYHNRAVEALLGYAAEEIEGREIRAIIPDDLGIEPDECGIEVPPNMILAFVGTMLDMKVKTKSGDSVVVEIEVLALDDSGGFVVSMRDVTSRLEDAALVDRLEAQLTKSRKLESVGQLAAGVAHEINTPTQFIGDNLHFLRDACGDLARVIDAYRKDDNPAVVAERVDLEYLLSEIPEALTQALEGIASISEIVAAMKAFCHPGQAEKVRSNLNEAVENVISVSRNQWKYVAEVDVQLEPHLPEIICNLNEIKQVLLNLVINASHALEGARVDETELGRIRLATRYQPGDHFIEIDVADNGPGIPPEVMPKLFDPFFTTKGIGKGTGQGLSVARTIVVDHHYGDIDVRSDPGKGATFTLRLPL